MKTVNMHDAKTHLSKYVEQALDGEEIVIGKYGKPLVTLTPLPVAPKKPRQPGALKDSLWIADDFDETPQEWIDAMEEDIDAHTA